MCCCLCFSRKAPTRPSYVLLSWREIFVDFHVVGLWASQSQTKKKIISKKKGEHAITEKRAHTRIKGIDRFYKKYVCCIVYYFYCDEYKSNGNTCRVIFVLLRPVMYVTLPIASISRQSKEAFVDRIDKFLEFSVEVLRKRDSICHWNYRRCLDGGGLCSSISSSCRQ